MAVDHFELARERLPAALLMLCRRYMAIAHQAFKTKKSEQSRGGASAFPNGKKPLFQRRRSTKPTQLSSIRPCITVCPLGCNFHLTPYPAGWACVVSGLIQSAGRRAQICQNIKTATFCVDFGISCLFPRLDNYSQSARRTSVRNNDSITTTY